LRKLIKSFAASISKVNKYSQEQEEQVEYALRVIVFETLKIIGTIIVFMVLGKPVHAVTALAVMIVTKPFIGGYHEDSQIKCFTAALIFIGCIIYLSININLDLFSKLILNGIALYCIWHQAPVVNPVMLITRPELIKRNRITGIILCIIMVLISLVFSKNQLISNTIVWTMVFQGLLMFNKRKL